LGFDVFDTIYPCGLLPLIVLGHPSHCNQPGRLRFHQEFLKLLDCSCFATLFGLIYSFLDAINCSLQLAPGQSVPSLARRVGLLWRLSLGRRFSVCHRTHSISSREPCSRQPICRLSRQRLLFEQSLCRVHLVGTYSSYRPSMRAVLQLLRSTFLCSVPVDGCYPPRVFGMGGRSISSLFNNCSKTSRSDTYRFGEACHPALASQP